jgi:hypothetical protein
MSRGKPRLRLSSITVAAFVLGVGLMIPFEQTIPRVAGVLSLLVFIACGAFLVANPEDLGREDEDGDGTQRRPRDRGAT